MENANAEWEMKAAGLLEDAREDAATAVVDAIAKGLSDRMPGHVATEMVADAYAMIGRIHDTGGCASVPVMKVMKVLDLAIKALDRYPEHAFLVSDLTKMRGELHTGLGNYSEGEG